MQGTKNAIEIHSGDVHNFGRRVRIWDDRWIHKPRPLVWEHLFLDPRSEIKQRLRDLAFMQSFADVTVNRALGFQHQGLMELVRPNSGPSILADFIQSHPASGRSFGALIAWSLWFGIHDLHFENICIYVDGDKLRLFPVDLECVFKVMDSPAETRLIPFAIKSAPQAAFEMFLPKSLSADFCLEALLGFLDSLQELRSIHDEIHPMLERMANAEQLLTRVILRTTRDYVQILDDPSLDPEDKPLIDAERQQLARGDIPYFFRDIRSKDILLLNEDLSFSKVDPLGHFEYLNQKNGTLGAFRNYPDAERFARWQRIGSFQWMNFLLRRIEKSQGTMQRDECLIEFDAMRLGIRTSAFWIQGQRV